MSANKRAAADARAVEVFSKVYMKTLTYSPNLMLVEFTLLKGSKVPLHKHVHEQIGYTVRGSWKITIGGKEFVLRAGDAYYVPSNMEHEADVFEDTVVVDVFSPMREEYAPTR